MTGLPILSKIGNSVTTKSPDGTIRRVEVVDEVTLRQSNYPDKYFVGQLLRDESGFEEIRIGYYIVGRKPRVSEGGHGGNSARFFRARTSSLFSNYFGERNGCDGGRRAIGKMRTKLML